MFSINKIQTRIKHYWIVTILIIFSLTTISCSSEDDSALKDGKVAANLSEADSFEPPYISTPVTTLAFDHPPAETVLVVTSGYYSYTFEFQLATAPGTYSANEGEAYCESLVLNSKTDWKLPSLGELNVLMDSRVSDPYPKTVPEVRYTTESGYYWSTTHVGPLTQGSALQFYPQLSGHNSKSTGVKENVRCIRN